VGFCQRNFTHLVPPVIHYHNKYTPMSTKRKGTLRRITTQIKQRYILILIPSFLWSNFGNASFQCIVAVIIPSIFTGAIA
ncbi:MAG: hypothetical protein RBQ79_08295, partial [Sphaerochaetaceae bacterium]|nr:hypothetical protein [Sphaerochaetaceae bacterium]